MDLRHPVFQKGPINEEVNEVQCPPAAQERNHSCSPSHCSLLSESGRVYQKEDESVQDHQTPVPNTGQFPPVQEREHFLGVEEWGG